MVNTFFQPVSESDVSKGQSSLATPTSERVVKSLETSRKRKRRKRKSKKVFVPKKFGDLPEQSIDPKKLSVKTIEIVSRDKEGKITGIRDTKERQSIGFSNGIEQKRILRIEQSRQPKIIGRGRVTPVTSVKKIDQAIEKAIELKNFNFLKLSGLKRQIGTKVPLQTVDAGAKLIIYTFFERILKSARDIKYLPQSVATILANPSILKEVPNELKKSGKEYIKIIKVSPLEAIAIAGTEVFLLKGIGRILEELGSVSGRLLLRLNPKFKGIAKVGKVLSLNTGKGKKVAVQVVASIPKQSVKKQVLLAGKKVNAISSQADALLKKIVSKKKVIRKPIPNEAKFSAVTKRLLNKFDAGKITKQELLKLDSLVSKQSGKGILERSFFLDPTGKIRPSRLGITKNKAFDSFLEEISRPITFKKSKPQILFFADIKVARFPKRLSKIKNKLLKGQSLTSKEYADLLEFQMSRPGQFKPLGFISGESEVTLPAGSIIRRKKKLGIVIIDKKRVPIVQAEAITPKGELKVLLKKWNDGSISSSDLKKLDRLLKKKTNFDYGLSYNPKVNSRYVSIKRLTSSGVLRSVARSKVYSRFKSSRVSKFSKVSRPSKPSKVSKPSRPSKPSRSVAVSKASPKKISKFSKVSRPSKPSKVSKPSRPSKPSRSVAVSKASPKKVSKPRKKSKSNKRIQGYYAFAFQKGKAIRLNKKPLTKSNALSLGARAVDKTSSATYFVRGTTLKAVKSPKDNYYTRNKARFKKGQKKRKISGIKTERNKYRINTVGEKQGITVKGWLAKRNTSTRKKTISKKKK